MQHNTTFIEKRRRSLHESRTPSLLLTFGLTKNQCGQIPLLGHAAQS